jgi:hypothetical protein
MIYASGGFSPDMTNQMARDFCYTENKIINELYYRNGADNLIGKRKRDILRACEIAKEILNASN